MLERNQDFYQIESFAKDHPKSFLDAVWPWFTGIIARLSASNNYHCTSYFDDHSISLNHRPGAIVKALRTAIIQFAKNDLQGYLKFVEDNQQSELKSVHRLLARGLEKVAAQIPPAVLDYLLGDSRRLCLGDSIVGHHHESKLLISSICPHLSPDDRAKIEGAILKYNYNDSLKDGPPKRRLDIRKYNREHQLHLLLSFPDSCLSPAGKKRRDEEIRAFPWVIEEDRQPRRIQAHAVGPRVTSEDLARSSDQNLLNLFSELNDKTEWHHPKRTSSNDLQWIGGSVQQSREFADLVKINPERFIRLLPEFRPKQHESYVGAALVSLSETDYSARKLIQIIEELNQRGFGSKHYYEEAARALGKIAERNRGLPSSILSLLQSWLSTHTQPELEQFRSKDENSSSLNVSILFDLHGSHFLPGGRGAIVRALAVGFLKQNPSNLKGWADFIRSQIGVEQHPAVWVDILTEMSPLLNSDRLEVTELFDQVICNCPEVLEYPWGVFHISRILGWFTPIETVQEWFSILLARNSTVSQQAYGELLILQYFHHQDEWSIECIRGQLSSLDSEAILCGLAHTASHLWVKRECRAISTEILTTLASSNLRSVQYAVANIFRCSRDSFSLNNEMLEIIQAVCKNHKILIIAANDLIAIIESENLVYYRPNVVAEICKSLLGIGDELINPAKPSALIAKSLTTISIQLHRQSLYRDIGLQLFEQLLSLNVRETQTALETLDRKLSLSS